MERLHIIAEAGTNHGARADLGRRLVDIAADAGADSVKFQFIYPEGLYLPAVHEDGDVVPNEVFAVREAGRLSDDHVVALAEYSRERDIPLSGSVFDTRGLDLLDAIDAPYIKIASTDLNNGPLLRAAAERGRRIVLSTGMSELHEVHTAVGQVTSGGCDDLVLLHCVSIYPCPTGSSNLSFITTLQEEFDVPVGYSDHTEDGRAALAAAALGATWFEKHITFDRAAEGFDHHYAMEPPSFASYVHDLRTVAEALVPASPKVSEAERQVRARARRALYAARDLPAGTLLTADDVLIVRPEGAMEPNQLDAAVGSTTTTPVPAFAALRPEMLDPAPAVRGA